MPTTSDYLTQLQQDREDLVDNLETKGITGLTGDETFTELVPEVLNISSGGTTPTKGAVITDYNASGTPKEVTIYGFTDTFYPNMPSSICSGSGFSTISKAILDSSCTSLPPSCFQSDTNLTTVEIRGSLNYISPSTFSGCTALANLDFTKISLTMVCSSSFQGCSSLVINTLPNTIRTIQQYAFSGCTNLALTTFPTDLTIIGHAESGTGGYSFQNCTNLAISSIPETVGLFGSGNINYSPYLFSGCTNITITKVPNSWGHIPSYCFNGCTSIPSMDLSSTQVTKASAYCFRGCTSMITANLSKVTELGSYAFSGCSNLESVDVRKATNLTNTFQSCTSLTTVNIDSATYLGNNAFGSCTSLKKIATPVATTIFGNNTGTGAFRNCTSLKQVWIGSTITSSGFARYAFYGCTNLEKMYIDKPRATVQSFTNYQYAFMNDTTKTGIIVCNDDQDFITREQFDALVVE